jgi:hypothetical protein
MNDSNEVLENAKKIIIDKDGFITSVYKEYLRLKNEYDDKVKWRNELYANSLTDPHKLQMWPFDGKQIQDEVDAAFKNWQVLGMKETIEKALNTLTEMGIKTQNI